MDEIVKAALLKWPNVPHCHGWLGLDARGDWFLRDARVQQVGPFPRIKGSRIELEKLLEFIARNYEHDDGGCWFFQNGPQRVYVELEAAPWIWRLAASGDSGTVTSHTGASGRAGDTWVDEQGRLFVATEIGLGLVHTLDMHLAASAVERGDWAPREIVFAELPRRYRYTLSPAAARA